MTGAVALAIVLVIAVAGLSLAMQSQRTAQSPQGPRPPRTPRPPMPSRRARERRAAPPAPPEVPIAPDPTEPEPRGPELLRSGEPAEARVISVVDERTIGPVTRSRLTLQIDRDDGPPIEVTTRVAFPTPAARARVRVGGTVPIRYDREDPTRLVVDLPPRLTARHPPLPPEEANLSNPVLDAVAALGGPDWLRIERQGAAARFLERGLPAAALEEWRYSRIDSLDLSRYQLSPGPPRHRSVALPGPVQDLVAAAGGGVTAIETHDGWVASVRAGRRGTRVDQLSDPDAPELGLGAIAGEPDALATLNRALAPAPVRILVGRGSEPDPIVVLHWVERSGGAVFPRILVEVEENATGSVLEVVAGPGAALVVPVTELDVGSGARLAYTHVQLLGPEAWQIGLQGSRVARDGSLVSGAVAIGGDYARLRTDSALTGPGADARLLALYFSAGRQMHDFRTVQHHQAPRTRSDLLYKGAVANSARSVYSGLIRVEKGARGTNAMQTNRNLVLHEGAHADSVPNLEIEDNDVRCSHASAVGPIAEDQRFYLESRGVPADVADRLIALGFLDEVLQQLPIPGLAGGLRSLLAAKLDAADALEADKAGGGR